MNNASQMLEEFTATSYLRLANANSGKTPASLLGQCLTNLAARSKRPNSRGYSETGNEANLKTKRADLDG